MAIKDIIASGIGFSPGNVEYIVTRGFVSGEIVIPTGDFRTVAYALFGDVRAYVLKGEAITAPLFEDKRSFAKYKDRRAYVLHRKRTSTNKE